MLGTSIAGSDALGTVMVLSQLAIASTAPPSSTRQALRRPWIEERRPVSCRARSEVKRIRESRHDRGGLTDVPAGKSVTRAEVEPQAGDTGQEVHQLGV